MNPSGCYNQAVKIGMAKDYQERDSAKVSAYNRYVPGSPAPELSPKAS
jgi:hypothetical protein